MMDKQIIIDGCEFQSYCIEYKDISYLKIMPICAIHELSIACHDKVNKCKYYTLYKQLKLKEQECERLSKGYAELTEIVSPYMDDFTGYNEKLGGFDIVLCVKELLGKLVLKEQALVNIKEIAESFCNACQEHEPEKSGSDCMYCNYGKILQKII